MVQILGLKKLRFFNLNIPVAFGNTNINLRTLVRKLILLLRTNTNVLAAWPPKHMYLASAKY